MVIVKRWRDILLLSLTGAFTFELLLPLGMYFANRAPVPPWYSAWFLWFAMWLGLAFAAFLSAEPFHFSRTHARFALHFPPLWTAIVCGVLVAAASEHLPPWLAPQRAAPHWQQLDILGALLTAVTVGVLSRHFSSGSAPTKPCRPGVEVTLPKWSNIGPWIACEHPASEDLFDHHPIASRISSALLQPDHAPSMALLATFR